MEQTPPGPEAGTPQEQTPPSAVHARRYGQQAGGTHPTGMHSCYCLIFHRLRFLRSEMFDEDEEESGVQRGDTAGSRDKRGDGKHKLHPP